MNLNRGKFVALGDCGLGFKTIIPELISKDYSSSSVPMESQLMYGFFTTEFSPYGPKRHINQTTRYLKKQVLLAKEYDLPILFYEPGNNRGLIDILF